MDGNRHLCLNHRVFLCFICNESSALRIESLPSLKQAYKALTDQLHARAQQAPTTRWPLVLFLHGAGDCGPGMIKLKAHCLPLLVAAYEGLAYASLAVNWH